MKKNRDSRIWLATILLIACTTGANAYIDPGSGSFALQFLIAGLLGLVYTVRARFGMLRSAIAKRHVQDHEDAGPRG
jgi:hypothetical protein